MPTNRISKRIKRPLFWSIAAVLLIGVFRNVQHAKAQDHVVDGSTSVLQEVITRADGSRMMSVLYKFATDTDGSSAMVATRNTATLDEPVRIVRLASGIQGYVSDVQHRKAVRPLGTEARPNLVQNARVPSNRCVVTSGNESDGGEEQISGYKSEKVGAGNRTSWYSLDYGCALLKEHFDWSDGGRSDKYLILLRPGTPESSLFDVPASYTDVPESAFFGK